jgi:type II secretory pathway predicted ATPase ExeA
MYKEIDPRLTRHFGLERQGKFFSKTCTSFCEDISEGFLHQKMVIVAGPVGTMKSNLFEVASSHQKDICEFVFVTNPFKEKVNIATIINAMIYSLSDESPRRDLEARTIQLRRILGEIVINQNKNVVVVIEEAHRLHNSIFRAIKELREMTYKGNKNLFSIVLIGHPQLLSTLEGKKEAYWRSEIIELNERNGWMTYQERLSYVKQVFGNAITPDAAKTIASLCKVPLQIVDFVEKKMKEARMVGKKQIDSEVVKPTPRELKEAYDVSIRDIAKESGLGVATVQASMTNPNYKYADEVSKAIERVAAKKVSENQVRKSA